MTVCPLALYLSTLHQSPASSTLLPLTPRVICHLSTHLLAPATGWVEPRFCFSRIDSVEETAQVSLAFANQASLGSLQSSPPLLGLLRNPSGLVSILTYFSIVKVKRCFNYSDNSNYL